MEEQEVKYSLYDIEDIARILIPEIITPDQLDRQERESGEILLLREVLKTAIMDLKSSDIEYRRDAEEWLLNDCGEISLRMCLSALDSTIDISWFRSLVKKFLSNRGLGIDNEENRT